MLTPVFLATVENHKLKIEHPELFGRWCSGLEGKKVEVIVRKKTKPRSTGKSNELGNQNGYYHAVVIPISAKHFGYTPNEMHEVFISEFAPYVYKDFGDKKIAVKIRSSMMNTIQFTEWIETIRMKMAEMGVNIPDPNKVE